MPQFSFSSLKEQSISKACWGFVLFVTCCGQFVHVVTRFRGDKIPCFDPLKTLKHTNNTQSNNQTFVIIYQYSNDGFKVRLHRNQLGLVSKPACCITLHDVFMTWLSDQEVEVKTMNKPVTTVQGCVPAFVSVKPLENQQNHDVFQPVVRLDKCSI